MDRSTRQPPPPPTADSRPAAELRDLLRRAGYGVAGIQEAILARGDILTSAAERPVHLRRLHGDGALQTLIRLFLLDEPVESAVVERSIAPTRLGSLTTLGVVAESGGLVTGLVRIVPHGDVVLVSDLPTVSADHVAGLHRPSVTLSDLTIRRPVRAALDMGTGNGIQAILAARHAERVVATDVNERALAFAALNVALNGVTNIELRLGSFFEPVEGEAFGLVVCNPPYVISPEHEFIFRDSGLGRDRVSERLVGELPGYLEEGGFGTILVSWIQDGPDLAARPRHWIDGTGCDAWILHTGTEDALTAAGSWNRELADDQASYAQAIDRWTSYFAAEGIEAVAYGAVVMRRRTPGPNWIHSRELPDGARVRPQDHLLRLFTGPDLLMQLPTDGALAGLRPALAEGSRITTHHVLGVGGWAETAQLTLDVGIPFAAQVDRLTAEFLVELDGTRTLGDVLDAFADVHEAPHEAARAAGLPVTRRLLELGLVIGAPAEGPHIGD